MKVYKPGSEVYLISGVVATVISATIGADGGVRYIVVWWKNDKRHTETVEEFEIKSVANKDRKIEVGFHAGRGDDDA